MRINRFSIVIGTSLHWRWLVARFCMNIISEEPLRLNFSIGVINKKLKRESRKHRGENNVQRTPMMMGHLFHRIASGRRTKVKGSKKSACGAPANPLLSASSKTQSG
eukprot:gnl/MRDRNA2_/MRDRNA2_227647_c0_seq1.p1 gnl/MRDRNA2_/MRDRNA2_227647_c0~~gnl/MRDRNA2_/MRDRNA2_227647_c0_seq1.p1  ORF type:complete len:107 (-),score=1.04 gnl/MRDRNA2_/MRDRNA2_227647_c0_seq1:94-414(-)